MPLPDGPLRAPSRRRRVASLLALACGACLVPAAWGGECESGYYKTRKGAFDYCCPDWGGTCKLMKSEFPSLLGEGEDAGGGCYPGPCIGHGQCYNATNANCCAGTSCQSVFDQYGGSKNCKDAADKDACWAYIYSSCMSKWTQDAMRSCVTKAREDYPAVAAAAEAEKKRKADEDAAAAAAAAEAERKKKEGEELARKRKAWAAAAARKKREEEAAAKVEEPPKPPAEDPLPKALEALFPGDAERVPRAVVEHLAKDKAAKDEIVAAAAGPGKDAAKAKWTEAAVKKAGEHLASPEADAAFASHLSSKGIAEKDLLGFFCPKRPAPGPADKPVMKELKGAEAAGAAASADGASVEVAKDGAALSAAERLEVKCRGPKLAETWAVSAASATALSTAGLVVKAPPKPGEAPPAGGAAAGGTGGGKGGGDSKLVGGIIGGVAGGLLGLGLTPLLGPIGIILGVILGALLGASLG